MLRSSPGFCLLHRVDSCRRETTASSAKIPPPGVLLEVYLLPTRIPLSHSRQASRGALTTLKGEQSWSGFSLKPCGILPNRSSQPRSGRRDCFLSRLIGPIIVLAITKRLTYASRNVMERLSTGSQLNTATRTTLTSP